jgi:hypothetical protein
LLHGEGEFMITMSDVCILIAVALSFELTLKGRS